MTEAIGLKVKFEYQTIVNQNQRVVEMPSELMVNQKPLRLTVEQLIEQLKKFPLEAEVYVIGIDGNTSNGHWKARFSEGVLMLYSQYAKIVYLEGLISNAKSP